MMERTNEIGLPGSNTKPNSFWVVSPREFIFKNLRYLPWILLSTGLLGTVAYLKIRYTPKIFRMQSSMLIKYDKNAGKDARFDELVMSQGTVNLSNEIELLKSTPVLERVVKDLNLQTYYYNKGNVRSSLIYPDNPFYLEFMDLPDSTRSFGCKVTILGNGKFFLNEDKTVTYDFGQTIMLGGTRFRMVRDSTVNLHAFTVPEFEVNHLSLADAAATIKGALKITQANDQATILTLSFEGEEPRLGNDVLNTVMAVYDTLVVEDKNRIAANTLRFINDRLFELSDTLKGVQGGLTDFKVQNHVFNIEGQAKSYMDKIDEGANEKTRMDVKIGVVDWLLNYISNKSNTHELVPTILGVEEPALLALVAEYNRLQLDRENNLKTTTPSNPLIVGLDNSLDKIRRDIYQALTNVKQSYLIAKERMDQRNAELQGHITALPGKETKLLNKERQQKILEDLYSLLLQKQLDIRLSSASTISNSRVVEPAISSGVQVSPDVKKTYTLYIFFGLLIPISIVALKEVLQDKVRGRADVEKHTKTPILGEIGHSNNMKSLVVTQNSRRLIAEQFRIVRTNLQYIIGKKEKPIIMVTSSFSGEGKSFISTNMGAVMALSGKKTVIMEFDIRKPKIVSGLDLKRKMGITNYIIGKASFNDLLVKVEGVDDLYVIPCGPIPPNPSELLLDKRLDELMSEVRANFEVVIMDTAPIGLVSDANNLGRFADCTVYIVRQGFTFRKQLDLIEELYANQKLPGLCLILNDVLVQGGYYGSYYMGKYKYYGGYGYGADSGYFEDETGGKGGRVRRWWRKLFQ